MPVSRPSSRAMRVGGSSSPMRPTPPTPRRLRPRPRAPAPSPRRPLPAPPSPTTPCGAVRQRSVDLHPLLIFHRCGAGVRRRHHVLLLQSLAGTRRAGVPRRRRTGARRGARRASFARRYDFASTASAGCATDQWKKRLLTASPGAPRARALLGWSTRTRDRLPRRAAGHRQNALCAKLADELEGRPSSTSSAGEVALPGPEELLAKLVDISIGSPAQVVPTHTSPTTRRSDSFSNSPTGRAPSPAVSSWCWTAWTSPTPRARCCRPLIRCWACEPRT